MLPEFDAELYLRLACERALLDPHQQQLGPMGSSALDEMATALAAIGCLDQGCAQEILDDHRMAFALRKHGRVAPPAFRLSAGGARPSVTQLHPARVVACDATLEVAGSHVHVRYVALSVDRTTLAVSMSGLPRPRGAVPGRRLGGGLPFQGLQLTDDRGRSVTTRLVRGADLGNRWQGVLAATGALAVDTRWIDVGTERLPLGAVDVPPVVEVEELPEAGPGERYLRSRLTAGRHGPTGGPRPPMIDTAVATLVDAGALAPDSPVIAEVRDVIDAFSGRTPARVPVEPWASLIAAMGTRNSRWEFVLPVGIVTPELCGTPIGVDALLAHRGVAEAHVQVTADTPVGQLPWSPIGTSPLSWWAEDDLGNPYLGTPTGWTAGPGDGGGTVEFWPSLHARARQVVLMPTVWDRRARIRLQLPERGQR